MRSSYSQFSTCALCPRKWHLSKKYEPRVKAIALSEGDVYHKALGKIYGLGDRHVWNDVHQIASKDYLDAAKLQGSSDEHYKKLLVKLGVLGSSLSVYSEHIAEQDLKKYEVIATEESFELKIGDITINGVIDGLWRERATGRRFIVEHKYKTDHFEQLMALDLQVSIYTMAVLEKYGALLPTLYNVTLKPTHRLGVKETPEGMVARVHGVLQKSAVATSFAGQEWKGDYWERTIYSRGQNDLKIAIDQIEALADLMERIKQDPRKAYRNVGEHCLYFCPFPTICADEDPIAIERLFIEKDRRSAPAV